MSYSFLVLLYLYIQDAQIISRIAKVLHSSGNRPLFITLTLTQSQSETFSAYEFPKPNLEGTGGPKGEIVAFRLR